MLFFIKQRQIIFLNIVLITIFSLILFLYPNLIGFDIFYHLKITQLLKTEGLSIINHLPWFQFTSWHQYSADLSLGYHLLLYPLIIFLNPIISAKILTIFLFLIFINFFLYFLKKEKIKFPFLWITLLLISSPYFLFRLFIFRPFLISIILSLAILYVIYYKKYLLLFLFTIIYLLSYSGWLQILIMITIYSIIEWLYTKKINIYYFIYTIIPLLLTLIVRPDFPNIVILNFQQVFGLLFLNLINVGVNVGMEQNSVNVYFILNNFLIYFCWFIGLIVFLNSKKQIKDIPNKILITTLVILSLFYGLWTMESIRFIEYFVPFTILMTAFLVTHYNINSNQKIILEKLYILFNKPLLKTYLIIAGIALIIYPFQNLYAAFKNAYPLDRYKITAEWLKNNTPEHTIVFHASWDSFPRLFFWNHHNYYIVGMDPTFMYLYNKELYWLWRHLTEDVLACDQEKIESCDQTKNTPAEIAEAIKTNFNSEYVWVNDYGIYKKFREFLNNHPDAFEKKIESDDSAAFKINPAPF